MLTLSIANFKGGTGKTATVRTLGDYLAKAGYKVLMLDIDPQASLTMSCGFTDPVSPSLVDVLGGANPGNKEIKQIIKRVGERLDLAPGHLDLAGVELGIASRLGREYLLKKALGELRGYDLVIIDCPPSISLLTINALVASDYVIIPTQPSPVDIAGVRRFMETINAIRANLETKVNILGILLTFYDHRYNTHKAALEAMRAANWPIMETTIGRSVRIAEAAALGQSVLEYDPTNPQAINYIELGKEIEQWLKKTK